MALIQWLAVTLLPALAGAAPPPCSKSNDTVCDAVGLLQTKRVDDEWTSPRDLAFVRPPLPMTWGSHTFHFFSVVPVFGKGTGYIALLHDYVEELWDYSEQNQLFCASMDGRHSAAMKFRGGDKDVAYKVVMAFHCPWPQEAADGVYHFAVRNDQGEKLGEVSVRQAPGMLGHYGAVACVGEAFIAPGTVPSSVRAPQWFEYYLMHGVSHFIVYTQDGMDEEFVKVFRRYLEDGVATRVHLNPNQASQDSYAIQHRTTNDCLYRAKHHAKWLSTTIDWDEYLRLGENAPPAWHSRSFIPTLWDKIASNFSKRRDQVHSMILQRYNFVQPAVTELDITSNLRQNESAKALCPKFWVNPDVVDAAFIHWATSWENGTDAIQVPAEMAFLNHYRLGFRQELDAEDLKAMVRDKTLLPEVPALQQALGARFHEPWETVRAAVLPAAPGSSLLRTQVAWDCWCTVHKASGNPYDLS